MCHYMRGWQDLICFFTPRATYYSKVMFAPEITWLLKPLKGNRTVAR